MKNYDSQAVDFVMCVLESKEGWGGLYKGQSGHRDERSDNTYLEYIQRHV